MKSQRRQGSSSSPPAAGADGDALADYTRLRSEAARLGREADRAAGALGQLLTRLREEFGCDSLEEGRALLTELEGESAGLETEYTEASARFEAEWGDRVRGAEG